MFTFLSSITRVACWLKIYSDVCYGFVVYLMKVGNLLPTLQLWKKMLRSKI